MKFCTLSLITGILLFSLGGCCNDEKIVSGPEIINMDQIVFVGLSEKMNMKTMKTKIGQMWQQFFKNGYLAQIKNKANNKVYGLYADYDMKKTGTFTCLVGCFVTKTDNIPKGLIVRKFPASKYAKFTTKKGPMVKMGIQGWKYIMNVWMKKNKEKVRYLVDFEEYEANGDPKSAIVKLYVSIK